MSETVNMNVCEEEIEKNGFVLDKGESDVFGTSCCSEAVLSIWDKTSPLVTVTCPACISSPHEFSHNYCEGSRLDQAERDSC